MRMQAEREGVNRKKIFIKKSGLKNSCLLKIFVYATEDKRTLKERDDMIPTSLAHQLISADTIHEERKDIRAAYKYVSQRLDEIEEQRAELMQHKKVLEVDYVRAGGNTRYLDK